MKKFLWIALLFISVKGFAQVTLEYTFSSPVIATEVAPNEWNYFNLSYTGGAPYTISIYSLNHSLITSFTTTGVPTGSYPQSYTLSKGLFTSDTTHYTFESISGLSGSSTEAFCDAETDNGTSILQVNNVTPFGNSSQLFNSPAGTKFLLTLTNQTTQIYSLPGTYAAGIAHPQGSANSVNDAYPNPTTDVIHLPYTLNANEVGEMEIVNLNGQVLKQYKVTNAFSDILLNANELPKGTYLYYLTVDSVRSQAKQFVVQ